jgi:penicillin-binding protein 2
MIANGGKSVDLTIVKNVVKSSGVQISRSEIDEFVKKKLGLEDTEEEHIDISEDNMKLIRQGMKSVTDDAGGTAYSVFRGFNIEVGGKTGSAETGKTEGSDIHAWFVGFAPYDDPEIAVTVMVENGGHGYYTAEAVRDIMAEYFGMNVQNIVEDMSVSSEMESYR